MFSPSGGLGTDKGEEWGVCGGGGGLDNFENMLSNLPTHGPQFFVKNPFDGH